MLLLEGAKDPLAGRRRVVVRDHDLAAELRHRGLLAPGHRVLRVQQHDQFVRAHVDRVQSPLGGLERDDAKVEAALGDLNAHLAGRHAPHVNLDLGMDRPEAPDEREQRVHRGLVGADEHAPAPQVAELTDRLLGLLRQAHQPLGILAQHPAGLGQRPLLRRTIEEALTQLVLEPPNRLADRRLRAVQLRCRTREAALGRHRQEHLQLGEVHAVHL